MKNNYNNTIKHLFILFFIIIVNLFIITNVMAENNLEEIIQTSQSLTLKPNINFEFETRPLERRSFQKSVEATLNLYPRDNKYQEIIDFSPYPKAKLNNSKLFFKWENIDYNNYNFGINSKIKTNNFFVEFNDKSKLNFPITNLNKSLIKYTKPSKHIDSENVLIKHKASEIVKGETNLFSAVYQIAKWVNNNVKYDLNTLTAEVSQKSSWVLENKYGVCDEITNLFIGLNRAVGIPARFVSGLTYTNTGEFANTWGLHGWAEVYFPGHGWIPFDVTYGQYGYIDASHIKLFYGKDQEKSSTEYKSVGVDLITKGLNYNVELIEYSGKFNEEIKLEAKAIKNEVTFGSYNLIELNIINNNPYYIPLKLHISKTQGLKLIGNQSKELLVYPNDKNKLFFKFKVSEDLDPNFKYTFPIKIKTKHGISTNVNFTSENFAPYYPLEEFKLYEDIKTLSSKNITLINLSCEKEKDFFYYDEDIYLNCNVKNFGNVPLNNLSICLDECYYFNLTINENKDFKLNIIDAQIGNNQKMVYVKGESYASKEKNVTILDKPNLYISNINYPNKVNYNEKFTLNFSINKNSFSNPKNVEIVLSDSVNELSWNFKELKNDRDILVNFNSSNLRKNNKFKIEINYFDLNNESYNVENSFDIKLTNLNFKQNTILFFREIITIIEKNIILSTLIITLIIFLILIPILSINKIRKELKKEEKRVKKESLKELLKEVEEQEKEDEKYFKD